MENFIFCAVWCGVCRSNIWRDSHTTIWLYRTWDMRFVLLIYLLWDTLAQKYGRHEYFFASFTITLLSIFICLLNFFVNLVFPTLVRTCCLPRWWLWSITANLDLATWVLYLKKHISQNDGEILLHLLIIKTISYYYNPTIIKTKV